MNRIKWILWRLMVQAILLLQKIKLPGFQGMGLYDVLKFFYNGLMDSKFTLLAAAMAYQFFFSFFPTLILVFIILPKIPIENLESRVVEFIRQYLPEQGISVLDVEKIAENYLAREADFLLIAVSIFLAVWGATRGIIAMMKAFTKNEDVFKKRGLFEMYGTALMIFFILGCIIILSVLGEIFMDYLHLKFFVGDFLYGAIRSIITLLTTFICISVLYYLAPPTQQRWKFISPGAVIAGILTVTALFGLRYYFANFANFNKLYGSLGAIILLMVWFYYLSIVLLIGFELNAAIDLATYHNEKYKKPIEETPETSPEVVAVGETSEGDSRHLK
ncbi:MAG: YihY/virulence factor BrkB family protein [Bacteroidia bacterium]|nr:YihY/virulence factor BrkB family protein [Bacteroidia bacterium]